MATKGKQFVDFCAIPTWLLQFPHIHKIIKIEVLGNNGICFVAETQLGFSRNSPLLSPPIDDNFAQHCASASFH